MKMVQNLSDRAVQQQKEREAFRQQMKNQANQDKEDLRKALNEKHDKDWFSLLFTNLSLHALKIG